VRREGRGKRGEGRGKREEGRGEKEKTVSGFGKGEWSAKL
jgi:hypothetical protein